MTELAGPSPASEAPRGAYPPDLARLCLRRRRAFLFQLPAFSLTGSIGRSAKYLVDLVTHRVQHFAEPVVLSALIPQFRF